MNCIICLLILDLPSTVCIWYSCFSGRVDIRQFVYTYVEVRNWCPQAWFLVIDSFCMANQPSIGCPTLAQPIWSRCFCMSEVLQGLLHKPIYGEASDCRCAHQRTVHTCVVPVCRFSDAWLMSAYHPNIQRSGKSMNKIRNSCRVFDMFYHVLSAVNRGLFLPWPWQGSFCEIITGWATSPVACHWWIASKLYLQCFTSVQRSNATTVPAETSEHPGAAGWSLRLRV